MATGRTSRSHLIHAVDVEVEISGGASGTRIQPDAHDVALLELVQIGPVFFEDGPTVFEDGRPRHDPRRFAET